LNSLVTNRLRGGLQVAAVKSPGFGDRRKELLGDLAVLTGGKVIGGADGLTLDQITEEMFGTCEKITITKEDTTIVNGGGTKEDISARIAQIKVIQESNHSDYDAEKLQERLAKLSGGVAVLYVGAASEVEMKEKKDRVDDALHATRAASEEGIVAGGGIALLRARTILEDIKKSCSGDEKIGVDIIFKALEAPIRTIVDNAGREGSVIVAKVLENNSITYGYNAKTNDYVDMIEAGIIDPKKVTRVALENAASVAGMILTTECALIDIKEDAAGVNQQAMGMPGMM
jgi:chaperonin GroEL